MKHGSKWIKTKGIEKINKFDITNAEKKYHIAIINKALNIKNKKERLSYLYDEICNYLDNEFISKNICGFKDGICANRRELMKRKKKEEYRYGCCYGYCEHRLCQHCSKDGCKIKNVACKLFTCIYLQKKGYRYSLNKIYFCKYFLTFRQKYILSNTYFVPKEEVMKKLT